MLRTADLDYHLPEELIATSPASPRDSARLMVLRRSHPTCIEHRHVRDLPEYLSPGDLMVVNRTRVLPARFRGHRTDTHGKAEGLFISATPGCHVPPGALPASGLAVAPPSLIWQVLLKLRRGKPNALIRLTNPCGDPTPIHLRLIEKLTGEAGNDAAGWLVSVEGVSPTDSTHSILDRIGLTPLPPYILAARKRQAFQPIDQRDREAYQTVFAAQEPDGPHGSGSIAAPTAGLHLTSELLAHLAARGVNRAEVILHVGMGTFKPVETEFIEDHPMHSERCSVPQATVAALVGASSPRSTILAVGTTTARTLESFSSPQEMLSAPHKDTRILITPGHRFKHVGALMTNFHLPRSTLLAMVAAFIDDDDRFRGLGLPRLVAAYRTAIELGYRFYSFGDAMVVLP